MHLQLLGDFKFLGLDKNKTDTVLHHGKNWLTADGDIEM